VTLKSTDIWMLYGGSRTPTSSSASFAGITTFSAGLNPGRLPRHLRGAYRL